jgi:hypothetical protein
MITTLLCLALGASDGGRPPPAPSPAPWVAMVGANFSFLMPAKAEPKETEGSDPELGNFVSTRWAMRWADEEFSVLCMEGPMIHTPKALSSLLGVCKSADGKGARTQLPGGAFQCSNPGPPSILVRVIPMGTRACLVGAARKDGEPSKDARRFVESFVKLK